MKLCLKLIVFLSIVLKFPIDSQTILNSDYCLRRVRSGLNFILKDLEEFLTQAENLLTIEEFNLSLFFQYYKQLLTALNEPFFSITGLKFPEETKRILWKIPQRSEAIIEKYNNYLSEIFEKIFPGLSLPFPRDYLSSIWQGQIEFAQNMDEFINQIREGFNWIERFKNGEIDGKKFKWKEVPLFALRMMIDLGLREKNLAYLVGRNLLREEFAVFNNRTLSGFEPRFEDFFDLQIKLALFPKNFSQWVKYIIQLKERGGGLDLRIIREGIMNPFIQRHFLEMGAEEKGEILYAFVKRGYFFEEYNFLNRHTLSFLYNVYEGEENRMGRIREFLEIIPENVEEWNKLLDLGVYIWWDEVKDEYKLVLIERRTQCDPLSLNRYKLVKAGLYGLYDHYGRDIKRLEEELIIPQLCRRVINEFIKDKVMWQDLDIRVVKKAQRKLLLRACSALDLRLSEFLSSEDNFMIPVPELGDKNLESILNYWGSVSSVVRGLELEDLLSTQYESGVYPLYGIYWSVILVAQLAKELGFLHQDADFKIENLHNLAWNASFGYHRLEEIVEKMAEGIGNEREWKLLASPIMKGILSYLSQKKLVRVVGENNYNKILSLFQDRITWIKKVLQQERAIENLLLEQLRKRFSLQQQF